MNNYQFNRTILLCVLYEKGCSMLHKNTIKTYQIKTYQLAFYKQKIDSRWIESLLMF